MAKVFKYRSNTLEELQNMNSDEFTKLLPSKARRHLKRGLTKSEKSLLKTIRATEVNNEKMIKTHIRNIIILPEFVEKKFGIHNGKEWIVVIIKPEMIGRRLGEFGKTRKRVTHSGPGIGATRGTKFTSVK